MHCWNYRNNNNSLKLYIIQTLSYIKMFLLFWEAVYLYNYLFKLKLLYQIQCFPGLFWPAWFQSSIQLSNPLSASDSEVKMKQQFRLITMLGSDLYLLRYSLEIKFVSWNTSLLQLYSCNTTISPDNWHIWWVCVFVPACLRAFKLYDFVAYVCMCL